MPNSGVIYWNSGTKLLTRLCVSLASLREVYDGNITVVLNNDVPLEFEHYHLNKNGFQTMRVETSNGHKCALLAKTVMHMVTPYDTTVYIDCDTLVLKPFNELFDMAREHKFVVTKFSDWPSSIHKRPRMVGRRIKQWGPEDKNIIDQIRIDRAYNYNHAINVGVYAFSGRHENNNYASIWDDWYSLAEKGRDTFIPDEIACQILLPDHKHHLASNVFNSSCRFDKVTDDTRIIHYHGRKHANLDKTKGATNKDGKCTAELWIDKLKQIYREDWCGFRTIKAKWEDRHSKWVEMD